MLTPVGLVVDDDVISAPSSIRVPPSSTLTQETGLLTVVFNVTLLSKVSVPPFFTVNMQDASELIAFGLVALTVTFPFILIEGWLFQVVWARLSKFTVASHPAGMFVKTAILSSAVVEVVPR